MGVQFVFKRQEEVGEGRDSHIVFRVVECGGRK